MDNNLLGQSQKKKKVQKSQNFIEAIRDVGGTITSQVKDLGSGVAGNAINSLLGKAPDNQNASSPGTQTEAPQPASQPFNFEDYLYNREKQIRAQERSLSQRIRENEKIIYNREDEETKQQIMFVKEEIKKIIKETNGLAAVMIETEKTIATTIVDGGKYHLNFFARVRQLLALARKKIAESSHWLELFNSRQKNKHFYWGKVKKSGTKFMLSQERYMSTQAG